jgi:[ribosomal protein S18]-alanine N-acetyltransferase
LDLSSVEIGRYEEGDIAEIMAIERDSYPTPWSEDTFRSELVSPLSTILIGRRDQVRGKCVAGYAVYWRVADEIHLHNIAVRRDLRRKGIAKMILTDAMRRSRLEGARWVTLEVRQSNVPAQMMYHNFGFSVKGVRPGYYTDTREDALIMWLDLQADSEKQRADTATKEKSDE